MYSFLKKKLDDNFVEHSMLWHIIENFYVHQGPDAWNHQVPFTITNLRCIAFTHAKQILRHHDAKSCLHIIDYGAGIGQHGYFLAEAIQALQPKANFKIILADISQQTFEYWQQHPQLSALIEQGVIVPHLLSGDIKQDITQIKNKFKPQAYVFNYLIDSLPLQAVSNGYLQKLRLYTNSRHIKDGTFNGNLAHLDIQFHCSGKKPEQKYQINKKHYTIPTKGIELLNAIFEEDCCQIAIINDKGYLKLTDIPDDKAFSIDLDGCFSSSLNFPILLSSLPTSLHTTQHGHRISPIKSCIIAKTKTEDNGLLCPEVSSLIQSIKSTPIQNNDHAIAICKILSHDRFCLELLSQSPHLTASLALDACIKKCLANEFSKPLDFTHLHTARIYRTTLEKNKSLEHLNAFSNIHPEHSALMLEFGIHYLEKDPNLSSKYLRLAAKDPKLHTSAQHLLEKIMETVNN